MKIPYNKEFTKPYHAIICEACNCPYQRECANHDSAGDFRTEGGFSPELTLKNGEVHCSTIHQPADTKIDYACYPSNLKSFGGGCVHWENIQEKVNNYQI